MVLIKNFLETVDNKADNFNDIDDINSVSLKIYKGEKLLKNTGRVYFSGHLPSSKKLLCSLCQNV